MATDLVDREDVRAAIRTGNIGGLPGATKHALRRRGLVRTETPPPYRQGGRTVRLPPRWLLTPAGEELRDRLCDEEQQRVRAERDAMGTVTVEVPVWLLRDLHLRNRLESRVYPPSEREAALYRLLLAALDEVTDG